MNRRDLIALLGTTAVSWPLGARAQQKKRVRRIGMLETTSVSLNAPNYDAFRRGMQSLGYVEGRDFHIEYRSAEGRGERFRELMTELLQLQVDVIVTRGTPAVLAAKDASSSIPIVMAANGDPLQVVSSLAHPGANITGLSGYSTDLEAKRIEVLKDLLPGLTDVAGMYNLGNPIAAAQWQELQRAARSLGLQSQLLDVRKPEDIQRAFDTLQPGERFGLEVGIDALTQTFRRQIAELAIKYRIPAIFVAREYVEAGGLIAYGPSYPDLYRRAASYVDRIFKGEKPGDLPIEQPTQFELLINLKTAKALGLDVPATLLARADEVIE